MKFDTGTEGQSRLEASTYPARIVGVIDLGTQRKEYDGKESFARQVVLQFEFPTETFTTEDGKLAARTLGAFYTASLNPKATLRKHLEQVRGKAFTHEELTGFDVKNLLGVNVTATVVMNSNGKPKVSNIAGPMKGAAKFDKITEHTFFDLDAYDGAVFETLPEFFKNIIADSPEYIKATTAPKTQLEEIHEELGNLF